jgi:ribosome-associated protein
VNENAWRVEGYEHLNWVIIDYVDIVVHIFFDEIRKYYNLERIWFDAKKVNI